MDYVGLEANGCNMKSVLNGILGVEGSYWQILFQIAGQ